MTDAAPSERPPRDGRGARAGGADVVPPAEWVVAALGLLLVLGVGGVLLRDALRSPTRPPDVTLAVDSVAAGRGGWLVVFEAANAGDQSVADVAVRATLATPRGDTLVREVRVDYLPARSRRGGGVVFPVDPRAGALRLEAVGFQEP